MILGRARTLGLPGTTSFSTCSLVLARRDGWRSVAVDSAARSSVVRRRVTQDKSRRRIQRMRYWTRPARPPREPRRVRWWVSGDPPTPCSAHRRRAGPPPLAPALPSPPPWAPLLSLLLSQEYELPPARSKGCNTLQNTSSHWRSRRCGYSA